MSTSYCKAIFCHWRWELITSSFWEEIVIGRLVCGVNGELELLTHPCVLSLSRRAWAPEASPRLLWSHNLLFTVFDSITVWKDTASCRHSLLPSGDPFVPTTLKSTSPAHQRPTLNHWPCTDMADLALTHLWIYKKGNLSGRRNEREGWFPDSLVH